MTWNDVKNAIGSAAPTVGALFGLPGAAIGKLVSSVLGTDNSPDAILKELKDNPDAIVKIREIEANQQVQLAQIAKDATAAYLADVQSARNREIETTKATGKRDINLYVLAWTVVVSFFIIVGMLLFKAVPEGQGNIVYMLLGTLGTGFITVLSYFFGSSKSSADKTEHLAEIAKQP